MRATATARLREKWTPCSPASVCDSGDTAIELDGKASLESERASFQA
jgi:hypothetical protein